MIQVRKATDRGHFDFGWLNTYHTFSFGDYYDPQFMGFRSLRVINEDWVDGKQGFGTHPHRDMEIVTYVLSGALEHKDSMGNGSVIRPGEVQYMSAGTGVTHSEFNHSAGEKVHLMQIWIMPDKQGYTPRYDQKKFAVQDKPNQWHLLVSPNGNDGSIAVRQDVRLFAAQLQSNATLEHTLANGRHAWLQVPRGAVSINGQTLRAGDGAAISAEQRLQIKGLEAQSEILLFDLN